MAKRKRALSVVIPSNLLGYKESHDDYNLTEKTLIAIMKKEYVEFRQSGYDGIVTYTIASTLRSNQKYPTFENIKNIVFNRLIPIAYKEMNEQTKIIEKLEDQSNKLCLRNSIGVGENTDIQICKLGERIANEKDKLKGSIKSLKDLNELINKLTEREINTICSKYDI